MKVGLLKQDNVSAMLIKQALVEQKQHHTLLLYVVKVRTDTVAIHV